MIDFTKGLNCNLSLPLLMAFSYRLNPAANSVVLDSGYYTNKYNYESESTLLGRGINMGDFLEAPRDTKHPLGEGHWTGGRLIRQSDFRMIKDVGFKSVRIPIRWTDHTAMNAPYNINLAFLKRVKQVIDWALAAGLNVVIDCHHYSEMMNTEDKTPIDIHLARLGAIWDQICKVFTITTYPADRLVFELLNEPNGRIGYSEWNSMLTFLTNIIWTENADNQSGRKLIIGTANWGGPSGLSALSLPVACNSTNTIITIHFYEPFQFTHQGAEWAKDSVAWIGTPWSGTMEEQQYVLHLLDAITLWNALPNRGFEIFIGEFGAYAKHINPAHQKAWTAFIAREAERRHMSWAYWEFAAGFGAYDPRSNAWRSQLLDALMPGHNRP